MTHPWPPATPEGPPDEATGTTGPRTATEVLQDSLEILGHVEATVRGMYARVLDVSVPAEAWRTETPAQVGIQNLGLDLADLTTKVATIRIHTELRVARAKGGEAP